MDLADPPVVATADDALLEDVLRWFAAVGSVPEVVRDVGSARRRWRSARAVVVGQDVAPGLAATGPPRRDRVLLVADEPQASWPDALGLGAEAVLSPGDERSALEVLTSVLDGRGEACLVAVVGATGGAGASTFAASVGLAGARRGLGSLLVDLDPLAGGLDLVLGLEQHDGARWADLAAADGHVGAASLARLLPRRDGLAVLSWGREGAASAPASLPAVMAAASRGFDLVVADVPRRLDPGGSDVLARSVCTVLVVPEDLRSLAGARRVLDAVREVAPAVALVSAARPGGLGRGAVADALGLPVLGRLRQERRLRSAVDHGRGPGASRPSRRAAAAVLDLLGLDVPREGAA